MSRRGYPIIALAENLDEDEDGQPICPEYINGVQVTEWNGEYACGGDLARCADDAEIRLYPGDLDVAYRWLEQNAWHRHPELFTAILMPTKNTREPSR